MPDADLEIELLLFDAALQIADEPTRRAFLDQTCAAHPEMRERLDELLDAHLVSDAYLSSLIKACAVTAEPSPQGSPVDAPGVFNQLGAYRLLERIGEGGCGVVYLAEQESPVRRRVALKVIRPGMDSERVIARFEMERQALAMMDHPHIAHVLDVGTTPYGRPYFAMEWVRGHKITDFCNEQKLDIRQRLELFIEVCQAIQHAHQKGVIHRDIKPSNVLVSMQDGKPQPKIIDFGIAKATDGSELAPDLTEVGGLPMGTLASMSPEQAVSGGSNVDTRGDVYSLGILLYELVCGQPAFDPAELSALGYPAALEILQHRKIPSPSAVIAGLTSADAEASAACRNSSPAKWLSSVKGDLDQVIMKCLEKDRSRRYETVNGLALDLARFLASEPVQARPPSALYRFCKFVDRNRVACVSGLLITLTVLAGFAVSTWLFLRENQARREQNRLRHEAVVARSVETQLRAHAEAREACAQAAVKLFYNQFEQADQLLAAIPTQLAPSSLEAADVYRKVGNWHRLAGRMQQAAERFTSLASSITAVDRSDIYQISGDVLPAAVATCEVGDSTRYEQVRQIALDRFGPTQNPIVAEQILKACLLRPADPPTMEKIAPLAAFLERSVEHQSKNGFRADDVSGWQCYSLALWHHRRNDPAGTLRWGTLSLKCSTDAESRVVCVRLLLAMAHHQLGESEPARRLLADAEKPISSLMNSSSGTFSGTPDLWEDWVSAHVLLKEALQKINE
jgi:serine/threonine protein kinase